MWARLVQHIFYNRRRQILIPGPLRPPPVRSRWTPALVVDSSSSAPSTYVAPCRGTETCGRRLGDPRPYARRCGAGEARRSWTKEGEAPPRRRTGRRRPSWRRRATYDSQEGQTVRQNRLESDAPAKGAPHPSRVSSNALLGQDPCQRAPRVRRREESTYSTRSTPKPRLR